MENELNINELLNSSGDGVELIPTLLAFVICILMAFVLRSFYQQRSFSLTGKTHISSIIPVLSAVVFIVIVVVKSSLALSLGLVGALSIVRFRTPIKEPEELVYLFLAIAIGLGYGAGHILITSILVTLTMLVIYFWLSNNHNINTNEYNLVINWSNQEVSFDDILNKFESHADSIKLIRLDSGSDNNMAVLLISPSNNFNFNAVANDLKSLDKNSSVSFYEAKTNW